MQSSFNIASALYQLLNVAEVTTVINGKVLIGNPSLTSNEEDVSINILNNPNQYIQSGFGNVNINVPKTSSGRNNLSRFDQLTQIIFPILEDADITTDKGHFSFQIDDDKGIIDDQDRDGMSYYNIKIEFQTH